MQTLNSHPNRNQARERSRIYGSLCITLKPDGLQDRITPLTLSYPHIAMVAMVAIVDIAKRMLPWYATYVPD